MRTVLVKMAFFLPDQDSDSDCDSAWDSMSDISINEFFFSLKGTQSALRPRWPGHWFLHFEKSSFQPEIKSLVEYIKKSTSIRILLCSIFNHCLKNLFFECTVSHLILLFFHIWLKTLWIASPKEHEKKRWETWRSRAEEIACFGKNNKRNKSEAMESISSLYIYEEKRVFSTWRNVSAEGTISTLHHDCSVWSSDEGVNSEYQLFHVII